MAPPSLVLDFIGIVFEGILYGPMYCLIFGLFWRNQLKRAERSKSVLLYYALAANFILCTACFIIDILIQVQVLITTLELDPSSLASTVNWLTLAGDSLYISIDFISQAILIYRCWIMWRQPLLMVLPCLLTLAFLVTALTTLGFQIRAVADNAPIAPSHRYDSVSAFNMAMFVVSLGANALDTALIVFKTISVYYDEVRGLPATKSQGWSAYGSGQRGLYPLISILVESGLITLVAQLAQSIVFTHFGSAAYPLVSGVVMMLFGISSTAVLVRDKLGVSYDHNASRTANSTKNFGHHIMFAPVPSKLEENDRRYDDYR